MENKKINNNNLQKASGGSKTPISQESYSPAYSSDSKPIYVNNDSGDSIPAPGYFVRDEKGQVVNHAQTKADAKKMEYKIKKDKEFEINNL